MPLETLPEAYTLSSTHHPCLLLEAPEPPQPAAAEAAPATQIPLLKMPKAGSRDDVGEEWANCTFSGMWYNGA